MSRKGDLDGRQCWQTADLWSTRFLSWTRECTEKCFLPSCVIHKFRRMRFYSNKFQNQLNWCLNWIKSWFKPTSNRADWWIALTMSCTLVNKLSIWKCLFQGMKRNDQLNVNSLMTISIMIWFYWYICRRTLGSLTETAFHMSRWIKPGAIQGHFGSVLANCPSRFGITGCLFQFLEFILLKVVAWFFPPLTIFLCFF